MKELWRTLTDPKVSLVGMLALVILAGFVLLLVGYRTIAATGLVPYQMPLAVSAGAVGVALIGSGLLLLSTHVDRVEAAEERRQLADITRRARNLRK